MQEGKFRRKVAEWCGVREFHGVVWELLEARGLLPPNPDEDDIEDVGIDAVRIQGEIGGGRPGRPAKRPDITRWLDKGEKERRRVVAAHVARIAEARPAVQSFRRDVLGDRFPLAPEETLRFVKPAHPHAERLDKLVEALARTYLWKKRNATRFVLSGDVPPVATFEAKERRATIPDGPDISMITLTVESWLSADKVRKIYAALQRGMHGKDNGRVRERGLKLLDFVEERRSKADLSWRSLMDEWNRTNPDDAIHDVRNFRKRYEQVYELVFAPGFFYKLSDDGVWIIPPHGQQQSPERVKAEQELFIERLRRQVRGDDEPTT